MKKPLALVCLVCAALAVTPIALAQTEGNATPTPPAVSCTPLKQIYSTKNWRDPKPLDGREACPVPRSARHSTVDHFYQYRRYRQIATMKCLRGPEGWFVSNPGSCTTLENESGLSWHSRNNLSGAEWVYQLLGPHTYPCNGYVRRLRCRSVDGGPDPSTFLGRLMNHEIASTLSRSAWTAPG